jgi:polysaccharide pyruvyl transferase WcaK-like protein
MNILVIGWYNAGNIGDELFKDAFRHLFPDYIFHFSNAIKTEDLKWAEAVFIGGGSFLHGKPNIKDDDMSILISKKIFYIGVGIEDEIHPYHLDLMKVAKLIAIRSPDKFYNIHAINEKTMIIPDLVYSLNNIGVSERIPRSVLVIPNIEVVPKHSDAQWKHTSWLHFKSEFAQFLDVLVEKKHKISFLPMCANDSLNDNAAAFEIINMMSKRKYGQILPHITHTIDSVTKIISAHDFVITQRFHGHVLSEMTHKPCLTIHHHDKLKVFNSISYYGTYKQLLLDQFDHISKFPNLKTIFHWQANQDKFKQLVEKVNLYL